MTFSRDYRIEILLCIPAIWLIFFFVTAPSDKNQDELVEVHQQWDLSKLRVATPFLSQADALRSVFEFRNIPVNTAEAELLATIPGIGPVLAQRIIDIRHKSGPYQTPADLARVHGIGPARVESFSPYLRFD